MSAEGPVYWLLLDVTAVVDNGVVVVEVLLFMADNDC